MCHLSWLPDTAFSCGEKAASWPHSRQCYFRMITGSTPRSSQVEEEEGDPGLQADVVYWPCGNQEGKAELLDTSERAAVSPGSTRLGVSSWCLFSICCFESHDREQHCWPFPGPVPRCCERCRVHTLSLHLCWGGYPALCWERGTHGSCVSGSCSHKAGAPLSQRRKLRLQEALTYPEITQLRGTSAWCVDRALGLSSSSSAELLGDSSFQE